MTLKGQPLNPVPPELRKALNLCDAEQRSRVLDLVRGRKKQALYRARKPQEARAATRAWQAKAVARGHFRACGAGYLANRASMARNPEHYREYHRNYYLNVTKGGA